MSISAMLETDRYFLYSLMITSLTGLTLFRPLLQDQSYHEFADQRALFGIPNFWNVISNLPFIAIGVAGLLRLRYIRQLWCSFQGYY